MVKDPFPVPPPTPTPKSMVCTILKRHWDDSYQKDNNEEFSLITICWGSLFRVANHLMVTHLRMAATITPMVSAEDAKLKTCKIIHGPASRIIQMVFNYLFFTSAPYRSASSFKNDDFKSKFMGFTRLERKQARNFSMHANSGHISPWIMDCVFRPLNLLSHSFRACLEKRALFSPSCRTDYLFFQGKNLGCFYKQHVMSANCKLCSWPLSAHILRIPHNYQRSTELW